MVDRLDLKRRLNAMAFDQSGYFTAKAAKAIGYSYQAQKYHVDRGNWTRVDRGVFRLPDWPSDASDIYMRWIVWSGNEGVISHQSAADVHGFGDFDAGSVHLTLPRPAVVGPEGVVLHAGCLGPKDVSTGPGFRVTSPLRTLLDLADSSVPQEQLEAALRDALQAKSTTRGRLRGSSENLDDSSALRIHRALYAVEAEDHA